MYFFHIKAESSNAMHALYPEITMCIYQQILINYFSLYLLELWMPGKGEP